MTIQRVLIALVAIGAATALVVAGLTQQDTRNASISVGSQRAEPGDTVEVVGTCTPESNRDTVPIVLRGSLEGGQLGEVNLDDNGDFSGTVEVPEMSSTGAGVVEAQCGIGEEPSTSLTVAAAGPAETSLSVTPQTVEPGESIDVAGTCTAGSDRDEVPITLGGDLEGGRLATIDAGADGDFSDTIQIPEGASMGSGELTAECGLGSDVDPRAPLTISAPTFSPVPSPVPSPLPVPTPSISVNASTVETGNSIEVTGTCTERTDRQETVIILGGGIEGGQLGRTDLESDGDFAASVTIPADSPTGEGTLFATCGLGADETPTTTLTVTEPAREPSIEADPSTVETGGTFDVIGTCTQRSDEEQVGILLGGGIEGGSLDVVTPDENGDFATTIELSENGATGEGTLFAACGLGDDDPRTTLTITEPHREPSIEANPSTVEAGGTFDVIGTCTQRSDEDEVPIILGGGIEGGQLGTTGLDDNGDFATTIEIPADSPTGEGTLFAGCGLGSDETPTTALTITEPAREPSIEANPSTVEAGDSFEVAGTCTTRSDEDEVGILLGGGIEGGSLGVVNPDDSGDFATTIELSDNAATGTGTLFAACGFGDDNPTTTLTIEAAPEPTISADPQTVEAGGTIEVTGTCTTRSDEDEVPIILGGGIEGGQLGTTGLDDNGDFATTIEIPADSPTGEGTLSADCGLGDDNPTTALTIEESENSGGDGIDEVLEPIQQGDAGGRVTLWQLHMNEWLALSESDFGPLEVDGQFGDQTQEATRIFQEANDEVPTDLIVHQEDRDALEESIERLQQEQDSMSLSRGDTGHAVSVWQESLNEAMLMSTPDYRPLAIDGVFDPGTEQATRAFQENNQDVESDLGPADRTAIRLAIERFDSTDSSPLRRGDQGGLVAIWQSRLNTWLTLAQVNYGPVEIDGVFGSETEEATRRFQEISDEVETDLLVHGDDWTELREAIDRLMGEN